MLPEKLQQLEANADQMIKALSEPATTPDEGASPSSVAVEGQDAADTSTDAGQTDLGVAPENVQTTPPATPADMGDELKALKQEVFNANQRWSTLQGMLDKKDQEIETMRALLAQLSQQPKQPEAPAPDTSKLLADAKEQFGDEIVEAMLLAADTKVSARIASLEGVINELRQKLEGVQTATAQTAGASFEDRLTSKVADWKQLNVDPGFMEWLGQLVPYTDFTRLQALQRAYQAMDLERTAQFFTDYKATLAPVTEPPATSKPNPANFAAPGRPKAAPTANEHTEKVWSASEITKLYQDHQRGRITPEMFEKLERDLFKAQEDGRIAY